MIRSIILFHLSTLYALCLRLGVDIRLTAWVTELMTGVPVGQASVSAWNGKNETSHLGLCTIGKHGGDNNAANVYNTQNTILIVEKDDDQCMLTDIYSYASNPNAYVWHVFNDRGLYKPKEDVHVKGYVRLLEIKGDAKLPTYGKGVMHYAVCDPRGQELQQSKVELNEYGAFDIKFTLPDNVNLGKCEHLLSVVSLTSMRLPYRSSSYLMRLRAYSARSIGS